jgi:hypothetical protein
MIKKYHFVGTPAAIDAVLELIPHHDGDKLLKKEQHFWVVKPGESMDITDATYCKVVYDDKVDAVIKAVCILYPSLVYETTNRAGKRFHEDDPGGSCSNFVYIEATEHMWDVFRVRYAACTLETPESMMHRYSKIHALADRIMGDNWGLYAGILNVLDGLVKNGEEGVEDVLKHSEYYMALKRAYGEDRGMRIVIEAVRATLPGLARP